MEGLRKRLQLIFPLIKEVDEVGRSDGVYASWNVTVKQVICRDELTAFSTRHSVSTLHYT
jgi:hypothetical protein